LSSARDIKLLEKLLEHIGKGSGLATYGKEQVKRAVDFGAVEMLLVTDAYFMENRGPLGDAFERVKSSGGLFHMMNHESEAGSQLESLGGIAALLRFKVE
jgi:protein pelota